jgi:hypothetical protein
MQQQNELCNIFWWTSFFQSKNHQTNKTTKWSNAQERCTKTTVGCTHEEGKQYQKQFTEKEMEELFDWITKTRITIEEL